MRVASVRSFLLSYPLPEPLVLRFYGGERTILKRDTLLIRVETDNGLVGYAPGPASERAHDAIRLVIAPFLEGKVLAEPDALRVLFAGASRETAELGRVYAAVEIALYDVLGQALDVPVSELLGGRVRDRIRLYGSAGLYLTPERFAEEAAAVAEAGFRAYKMRPALGPERDLECVRSVREAVGPRLDLMVDAHSWWRMGDRSYDVETVDRLAEGMADAGLVWLEEPLPPDNHQAYLRLKERDSVALASGEHEPGDDRYLDLIQNRCVDYVQMDLCCQGGYPSARLVLGEVSTEGLGFAFHNWGTALELVAAAQVAVCWPELVTEWLEYPCYAGAGGPGMYPFPLAEEILTEPVEIREGELVVPRGAGLGVRVDEKVIERYPWLEGPWSTFRLDSPPQVRQLTSDQRVRWEH